MAKPTQEQIDKWLSGVAPARRVHLCRVWKYVIAPKFLKYEVNKGFIFALMRLASLVAISSIPLAIKCLDGSIQIGWIWVVLSTVLILALQIYNLVYDNMMSHKKVMKNRRGMHTIASLTSSHAIEILNKCVKTRAKEHCDQHGRLLIQEVLVCVQHILAAHVDEDVSKTQACLLQFEDEPCNTLCVFERAKHVRPIGVGMPTKDTMAYYIMKTKKHYVLYDFLTDHPFDKSGISDPRPSYRSVLFIPIIERMGNGSPDVCHGMLTVETEKPYQFWFGEGDRLAVKLAPYVGWLLLIFQQGIVKSNQLSLE